VSQGIFPREPRHRKRANKGNSVSTSFYYAKDIAFLAHEPVLRKLREHKAFAKKLSRALGRGEWSSAKSLDDNRPTYRLDHIVKERCATQFIFVPPSPLTYDFAIDIPPSTTHFETSMTRYALYPFFQTSPQALASHPPS